MSKYVCLKQKTFDQLLSQALANCSRVSRNIENYKLTNEQSQCIKNCDETQTSKRRREACYRKCIKVENFTAQEAAQCHNKCLRENETRRDRGLCFKKCPKLHENFAV